MSRELFLVIIKGVRDYDDYFEAKYDYTGKIGFSSYQKCPTAIRQLAYALPGDLIDDYMRMGESTCHKGMYQFCVDVTVVFDKYYLGEPNTKDNVRILSNNESRGLPGMPGIHALAVEELPFWLASSVQRAFREVHGHIGGCCITRSTDLALLLCHGRIKQ
jgi:hypothetical protein